MKFSIRQKNNMNIAILTIDDQSNYGNRLQNYAMQNVLKRFGDCQSLWWSVDYDLFTKQKFSVKEKIKFLLNYKNYQKKVVYDLPLLELKKFQIKKFTEKYIDVKQIDLIDNDLENSYDFFITGSDQIWNPLFWLNKDKYAKAMFLQFCSSKKRIAYAASFGLSKLPYQYEKQFASYIDSIEHISVRENSAAKIIKNLTGRDVPVVLDPTLMISAEQWASIEMAPEWYKGEKFIFTYFLGDIPKSVLEYAKKRNIKIYNLTDKRNVDIFASRVEEFIYLIHHCELFCTDSFHGSVFAIQFKKPFIVMNRQEKGAPDMTCRIDTLLDTFNLKDRYFSFNSEEKDLEKALHPDYSNVDEIFLREREKSNNFVTTSLGLYKECEPINSIFEINS